MLLLPLIGTSFSSFCQDSKCLPCLENPQKPLDIIIIIIIIIIIVQICQTSDAFSLKVGMLLWAAHCWSRWEGACFCFPHNVGLEYLWYVCCIIFFFACKESFSPARRAWLVGPPKIMDPAIPARKAFWKAWKSDVWLISKFFQNSLASPIWSQHETETSN